MVRFDLSGGISGTSVGGMTFLVRRSKDQHCGDGAGHAGDLRGERLILIPLARQLVGSAERVGQPVPPGHVLNQDGRVAQGQPGGGYVECSSRAAPKDLGGMRSRPEGGLRNADHRYPEGSVCVRAETGAPGRVQRHVAVEDEQVDRAGGGEHRGQGG